jgi:hypothetical protein
MSIIYKVLCNFSRFTVALRLLFHPLSVHQLVPGLSLGPKRNLLCLRDLPRRGP